jgi:hypothetical protein
MPELARLRSRLTTMLEDINPPPVPLLAILEKAALSSESKRTTASRGQFAAAAAAIIGAIAIGAPLVAPSVVMSIEARIAQVLQWTPPPVPPPRWLTSRLRWQSATLASARARVPFTVVPPAGLPRDVTAVSIATAPSGVYDKLTRSWELGSQAIAFTYQRSGNRSFTLLADRFDPRTGPPSQYMYEYTGRVHDGLPVLVRHDEFTWRNGDQVMTAIDGAGITADEIRAIQNVMHGVPVAVARTRAERDSGEIDKLYHVGS